MLLIILKGHDENNAVSHDNLASTNQVAIILTEKDKTIIDQIIGNFPKTRI